MTNHTESDRDAAYWRAYLRKLDAEAEKTAREARWYPWLPIAVACVASVPLWAAWRC